MNKVSLLSLGCPKNLVDSESLLKRLTEEGIYYSPSPEDSNIIMINTCGFIEDAKKESIDEILRFAQLKGRNRDKKLIVFGCLAKRYGDELYKEIPEIDAIWGVSEEDKIIEYCKKITLYDKEKAVSRRKKPSTTFPSLSTASSYAYLKIAEGCDRGCSYCVIPQIRGKFKSRNPEHIFNEAENFVKSGIKELILVAQDMTSYGRELDGYNLSRLIKDISSINGDFWLRLLYLYPTSVNDELLETIKTNEKVCKYIDMPLQHSETKMLRLMGRGGSRGYIEKLVTKIRDNIPDVNIRTTLIVGFPQETGNDFNEMVEFVRKIEFDRLGVFTYSKEDGTPAFKMKGQIPKHIKIERHNKIMEIQSEISLRKNKLLIGRTFKALVDKVDGDVSIARLYSHTPDIDGVVFINNSNFKKGSFVNMKIEEAYDYDLKGAIV